MDKSYTGQKLWEKAKTIIPGGNQLLSKRSEMFLPKMWPSYYEKAKGCQVWDLDGNVFYDFAQMGVGSCILGYADPDVNQAVIEAISKSSMSTLNCYEEVELAELLIELHPWADMARFSRSGGEACSIAVRIARAASGKDKVAFCGYHGWHDWYLSSNLSSNNNLDGQLLPGLKPKGVPRGLIDSALPFNYNDIESLEQLVSQYPNQIGVIYMEPQRGNEPKDNFLKEVRKIADRIGAVLVFDEVTSGFRVSKGGIHMLYGVEPDIAVFGKALGNGFPISAVIGRRKVMDVAQESFISSTFWTERIGFVAALATVRKFVENDVHENLIKFGNQINHGWQKLTEKHGVKTHISGLKPLTHIDFMYPNPLEIQTYYTQELLKKGFLLGASIYTTNAYTDQIIDSFIEASDSVFERISVLLPQNKIRENIEFEVKHSGFKRLT